MSAGSVTLRTASVLDARLAIPAAVAWGVTAIVVGAPEAAAPVSVLLWAAAGVVAVLARRSGVLGLVALVCAAAAACCTSTALQIPARSPDVLVSAAEERTVIPVVLEVTRTVREGARSWPALAVAAGEESVRVDVLVVGNPPEHRVDVGARVMIDARIVATEPGDDRAWLLIADTAVQPVAPPPVSVAWAAELRSGFTRIAEGLPGAGGQLLPGLAIGDTGAVGPELDDAMTVSSLSHLTAVSGSNCAIVVALAMLLGRALGLPRVLRVATALALLAGFVVLVTPEPSVQRAAAMAVIVLLLIASGRPLRGLPVLALAVLTLLVADPWLSRSAGFALSVLATAGLLVLAPALVRGLQRMIPGPLALVVAVPVAAQIACQPVLVAIDPVVATYGVAANLLAAPAAPVATVLGMIACVLAPVAPALAGVVAALAWVPAAWIAGVAHLVASLPASSVPWPSGFLGVVAMSALTAAIAVVLLARGRLRRAGAAALAVLSVVVAGIGVGASLAATAGRPAGWQFALCDVGQGDAVVVRSGGATGLIDTGPNPDRLEDCLEDLGVERLDLVVLTHYDLDHVGGWEAIRGRADLVLVGPTDGAEDEAIVAALAAAGARIEPVRRGDEGILGEWRWRVEWPTAGAIDPGNDASLTIRLDGVRECAAGCLSGLFLGDLGAEPQSRLMRLGVAPVDVVKVSHHGSADQDPTLYAAAAARVGLIGVGVENGYGHPTRAALEILELAGTSAWRADRCGLVLVAPEPGSGMRVWSEHARCADGPEAGVGGDG